ncbi:MAG: translation elongation factor Ts [Proteobacteria bacterium]|nr:translation elongation factor Ts [Pseudomonadota bacterium]
MAEITAAAVKELREKSGAGMMDCKSALTETDGDMEAAIDWLRKKGLSAAEKKAGRAAAEGLVGMAVDGTTGALVEVNSETDFVARNEIFQGFVAKVTALALVHGNDEAALRASAVDGGSTVDESVIELVGTIGENIGFRRSTSLSVNAGVVSGYVHNQVAPGLGKIGVLVALESTGDVAKLDELGRQLAMHVAAAQPQFLDIASVDASALDREREVLAEQARASGKPEEIVEKMVEGRLRKFYEEVVLDEQTFVIDGETKISKVVGAAAKEIGAPISLAGFVRFTLGEGIERREDDFADEVAKLAN